MKEYSMADPPSRTAFPVARAGYPFLYAAAFATAVFALLGITAVALLGLLATVSIALFFRDPDRMVPAEDALVVAPADGKVVAIERVDDSPFYEGSCTKVGIFMSVFNVHINRIPHEGTVTALSHRPGRFLAANRAEASLSNEHNAITLETGNGQKIGVVQIAGWVARRIICSLVKGEEVKRGQRFGLICFGSRVDLYLPETAAVDVAVGTRVRGGTTIIGRMA